jgi:uncharacterized RDD family membrane protein YckC
MILPTMAVAAAGSVRSARADYARDARLARAGAVIVDAVVFGAMTLVVNSVYGVTHVTSGSPLITMSGSAFFTSETSVPWPWLTLLGLVYFTVFESLFGATPGKLWARVRVVRLDGQPLDLRAVVIRNLLKPVDFLPVFYLLGGALVVTTAGSQRLGDMAAGTTVVYRHRALEPGATRSAGSAARRWLWTLVLAAVLFTLAFNYFGRPPLVIEGMFNQGQIAPGVTSYRLGDPQWGFGTVTYPVVAPTESTVCRGTITLQWFMLGWSGGGSSFACEP